MVSMNPSNILRKIRKDLSPYLFHFTKGDRPMESLQNILSEMKLYSQVKEYVCFTEAPITSFIYNLEHMSNYPIPMFSSYGIGFNRDFLFRKYNARPVIYGDTEEQAIITKTSLKWRFELMNIDNHDFSWLREWRIKGVFDFSNFPKDEIIIIAPNDDDLRTLSTEIELVDIDFVYEHEIRGCFAEPIFSEPRKWKGVSIDSIRSQFDDFALSANTTNQTIGEQFS